MTVELNFRTSPFGHERHPVNAPDSRCVYMSHRAKVAYDIIGRPPLPSEPPLEAEITISERLRIDIEAEACDCPQK